LRARDAAEARRRIPRRSRYRAVALACRRAAKTLVEACPRCDRDPAFSAAAACAGRLLHPARAPRGGCVRADARPRLDPSHTRQGSSEAPQARQTCTPHSGRREKAGMLESAEIGHRVTKEVYEREERKLRAALLNAQYDLSQSGRGPVLLIISGVEAGGRGETDNKLTEWMDPRHI